MSYTPPNPNGQANSANSAPAVLSSEQEAILQAIKDGVDGLEALITTLNGNTDGLETLLATLNGYVDGLEGKDYATQTTLALIAGYVDTIESLITNKTTAGDIAHDAVDSGNPVKIGFKARNAFPAAVANGDRVDSSADLFGRQLTSHIDPSQNVSKSFNATTQQTGTDVWTPASGKKIAITSIVIGTYGTTAARLILWFGANADTTYTAGTDQLVLAASFAPSSTAKPGLVFTPAFPIFCNNADYELHCTTDAGLSVDIAAHGYEF